MAVTALEIQTRSTVLDGRAFGRAGAYETLAGIIRFAVDPRLAVHAPIADIALAPTNARGLVESWADFYLLRPVDPAARESPAPPRRAEPRAEDRARPLQQRGARARSARARGLRQWISHAARLHRRVGGLAARRAAPGRPHGALRPGGRRRPAADLGPRALRVPTERRRRRASARGSLPHSASGCPPRRSGRRADRPRSRRGARRGRPPAELALRPPRRRRHRPGSRPRAPRDGLRARQDLRLLLSRRAPAARRARLHRGAGHAAPSCASADAASGNPCAGSLDRAYVFGVSQSGRFLRHLLYLGLDEDEGGRSVFDGVIPHVAGARRGEFNCRFGQPSLNATESLGSLFPFADLPETDPVTGQRAGLLDRVLARASRPKIVSVNTSAEYWRGDASLTHIDGTGSRDVEPAPDVRAYLFAGTQHLPGTLPPPSEDANTGSRGLHVFNAVDYAPLLRAVLVNLDRWVTEGVEPPASAVPRLGDGSAVPAESTAPVFRALPGTQFPDRVPRPQRLDFGPDAERGILERAAPQDGGALRDVRLARRRRRERDGRRHPSGIGRARRDLHGVESPPSEPGRAGRSDEHDGLDGSARPNRGRASRERAIRGRPSPSATAAAIVTSPLCERRPCGS